MYTHKIILQCPRPSLSILAMYTHHRHVKNNPKPVYCYQSVCRLSDLLLIILACASTSKIVSQMQPYQLIFKVSASITIAHTQGATDMKCKGPIERLLNQICAGDVTTCFLAADCKCTNMHISHTLKETHTLRVGGLANLYQCCFSN